MREAGLPTPPKLLEAMLVSDSEAGCPFRGRRRREQAVDWCTRGHREETQERFPVDALNPRTDTGPKPSRHQPGLLAPPKLLQ